LAALRRNPTVVAEQAIVVAVHFGLQLQQCLGLLHSVFTYSHFHQGLLAGSLSTLADLDTPQYLLTGWSRLFADSQLDTLAHRHRLVRL
jgi:hypothetical protein